MIRLAKVEEMEQLLSVYEAARRFMRANGNPNQWSGGYPSRALLQEDIEKKQLYVVLSETSKDICGAFVLLSDADPTYAYIEGEGWLSDAPYGTIHKVASNGTEKGVFVRCLAFARSRFDHLRIDTHEDNLPMQSAILKNGFSYRGIIYLENGDGRLAYEWIKDND